MNGKNKSRKSIKRLGLILLSIVLCFVLVGCASDTDSSNSSSGIPIEAVETQASEGTTGTTIQALAGKATGQSGGTETSESAQTVESDDTSGSDDFDLSSIPDYTDSPYVEVNDNIPYFTDDDLTTTSYEFYSELDSLGRCGVAVANIGEDLMPTEERGSIGSVKPTGWHTVRYDDIVDGNYLYNRCHLIGYQLSGENANEQNLITGTRYLNVEGMLPFENMVADYVQETGNHVLYRVTPMFDGDNLLASGGLMEAMSVEDDGEGILFCVYCYNVQPGVGIDYATGDSWLEETDSTDDATDTTVEEESVEETETESTDEDTTVSSGTTYILNTNTMKFHYPWCSSVDQMSEKNKAEYTGSRDDVIARGYDPCKRCNP